MNVEALARPEIAKDWRPYAFEARFGMRGRDGSPRKALEMTVGSETIRLRGVIDRIDRDALGHLRIIDYKSGKRNNSYSLSGLQRGERLQLPLYALAAERALGLGKPREGYYWHLGRCPAQSLAALRGQL